MSAARLFAPAKLNLGLRIVGRRADGYHELESLFVALAWGDDLELEVTQASAGVTLSVAAEAPFSLGEGRADFPTDERNLVARAARAFLDAAGIDAGVRVRLWKRIPAGAGLGGGSSNAAATLRGLCARFPEALAPAQVAALALGLGADVPFFLDPRPSRVRGIGERIEPIASPEALADWAIVLANPGNSVATAAVYAGFDAAAAALTPPEPGSTIRPVSGLLADPSALGEFLRNDLEPAACRLCPAIRELRERLGEAGALATGMSGSGATVFGIFESGAAADAAAVSLDMSGVTSSTPEASGRTAATGPGKGWALAVRIVTGPRGIGA